MQTSFAVRKRWLPPLNSPVRGYRPRHPTFKSGFDAKERAKIATLNGTIQKVSFPVPKKGARDMAIYHMEVKTVGRSQGRSATAAAAYRAGDRIADERTGLAFDYTRRGGLDHTEIFLPEHAPEWAENREQLWNAAEAAEKRINSTVAREFEVALPAELSRDQRVELVREFAEDLVKRHGLAVDVAVHKPGRNGDSRNHHAHVLCSTRRLGPEGFTEKSRELDDRKSGEVNHWRERWAELANTALDRAGHQARVDHRSLEAQGIERLPTVHMGPNAVQMERRNPDHPTERGDINRQRKEANAKIIDLAEARKRIEAEREAQKAREMVQDVPQQREQTGSAPHDPEEIKIQWKVEQNRQFEVVFSKAERVQAKAIEQLERQETRLKAHTARELEPPRGIFASFGRAAHEKAAVAWRTVRDQLSKRFEQLRGRVEYVADFMRRAGPHGVPTRGDRLALSKAEQSRPELAKAYRETMEHEKDQRKNQILESRKEQREMERDSRVEPQRENLEERTQEDKQRLREDILRRQKEQRQLDRDDDELAR